MLVGILSDTHDRADAAASAIALLKTAGAEFFIHCGDVGTERVLDHMAGLRAAFVWGNNDWDRRSLQRYGEDLGLQCLGASGELELGGKRFAILHGDDFAAMKRIVAEARVDYLLHGHSHVRRDERIGSVRIINPGALHRAREKSVALLDTDTDRLRFIPLPA